MGILSRRGGERLPVQARRVGSGVSEVASDPIVIEVPAGQPAQTLPPLRPEVTQNIVYIIAPQATGPETVPQPAQTPPREVHYHQTNNYTSIKRRREKGTSFFGFLSVIAGLLACACAYLPAVTMYVSKIAQAGLALGGLGLILAILFRRSGRAVPVLGLFASAIAFPIWFAKTGQLQGQYDQLRSKSPVQLPPIDFSGELVEFAAAIADTWNRASCPGGRCSAPRRRPQHLRQFRGLAETGERRGAD